MESDSISWWSVRIELNSQTPYRYPSRFAGVEAYTNSHAHRGTGSRKSHIVPGSWTERQIGFQNIALITNVSDFSPPRSDCSYAFFQLMLPVGCFLEVYKGENKDEDLALVL